MKFFDSSFNGDEPYQQTASRYGIEGSKNGRKIRYPIRLALTGGLEINEPE